MKAMLASDADEAKLKFPLIAQPKVDGVRGLNLLGTLTGRSLKQHANKFTTAFFSTSEFLGFDGELAAERDTHPDLCRLTTSALNTIAGEPFTLWWLFDYIVVGQTKHLPYSERYAQLHRRVTELKASGSIAAQRLRVVPAVRCETLAQLLEWDARWLDEGYEGSIVRDPNGMHKEGRSTIREGGLLRIKRFVEEDALVVELHEGETNTNEAQRNELGLQYRTTHAEGMVPNGQVGRLTCKALKDVVVDGRVIIQAGELITVAPGCMPVDQRQHYFNNPGQLVGQVIKFKFFPKGIKDSLRFPTFQSLRSVSDM